MGKDKSLKRCSSAQSSLFEAVANKKASKTMKDEAGFSRRTLNKCSSSSLQKEKRVNNQYIFICASGAKTTSPDLSWYKIDASKTIIYKESDDSLPPICTIPAPEIGRHCGTVALGSKIYMMGGYLHKIEASSHIFSFETTSSSTSPLQWHKHSTELLSKRVKPTLIAAQGKIYIFGSNYTSPHPWAEVFDPESNTSFALPHPPSQISGSQNASGSIFPAVVDRGERILLSIHFQFVLSFNPLTNAWSKIHIPPPVELSCRWGQRGMVIDEMGIMLTFAKGRLFAYEYGTGEWYPDPICGLDIISISALPKYELHEGQVVNHGNKVFSVIWNDYVCNDNLCESINVFRCIQFQLTKVNKSLQAHILARCSYKIEQGDDFYDCFPM